MFPLFFKLAEWGKEGKGGVLLHNPSHPSSEEKAVVTGGEVVLMRLLPIVYVITILSKYFVSEKNNLAKSSNLAKIFSKTVKYYNMKLFL